MTHCPDPANNCECLSLYNGECILPEVRRYCDLRRKRRSTSRRQENDIGDHFVDVNKMVRPSQPRAQK